MAKARTVQVPGEPAQELPTTTEAAAQELPSAAPADADEGAGEPTAADHVNEEVAALRAQLEAERLANIEAQQRAAAAEAKAAAAAISVAPAPAPVVAGRPGQTPQLTDRGWVVPHAYGAKA